MWYYKQKNSGRSCDYKIKDYKKDKHIQKMKTADALLQARCLKKIYQKMNQ